MTEQPGIPQPEHEMVATLSAKVVMSALLQMIGVPSGCYAMTNDAHSFQLVRFKDKSAQDAWAAARDTYVLVAQEPAAQPAAAPSQAGLQQAIDGLLDVQERCKELMVSPACIPCDYVYSRVGKAISAFASVCTAPAVSGLDSEAERIAREERQAAPSLGETWVGAAHSDVLDLLQKHDKATARVSELESKLTAAEACNRDNAEARSALAYDLVALSHGQPVKTQLAETARLQHERRVASLESELAAWRAVEADGRLVCNAVCVLMADGGMGDVRPDSDMVLAAKRFLAGLPKREPQKDSTVDARTPAVETASTALPRAEEIRGASELTLGDLDGERAVDIGEAVHCLQHALNEATLQKTRAYIRSAMTELCVEHAAEGEPTKPAEPWVPKEGETVRIRDGHLRAGSLGQVLRLLPGPWAELRILGADPKPGEVYPAYPFVDLEPHTPEPPEPPKPPVDMGKAVELLRRMLEADEPPTAPELREVMRALRVEP